MNSELWMVIVPAIGWALFALGGTQISSTIKGQKWIRRFVLPFLFALCVGLAGVAIWKAVLVAILAIGFFHLGYGDRSSWPMRLVIFSGYGIVSAPIGLSFWNIFTALGCFVMMFLSRTKLTANIFVWKICEGAFGALIGISISYLLAGNGWVW